MSPKALASLDSKEAAQKCMEEHSSMLLQILLHVQQNPHK